MGTITNILPVLIFFIYFSHSSSDSKCIESERKALLEFKTSVTDGSDILPSWSGSDCCSWEGVTCHDVTSHVQELNLGDYDTADQYQFNSPLSPWLFNLTHLEVLSMAYCGLRGSIPNMFEKLTSLTSLDLSGNSFGSSFPDSLCALTNLTYIDLSQNQLQGSLPFCLGNLNSLTEFYLSDNELSGEIPGGLGRLTNLTTLDFSQNHFNSSIPTSFGLLGQLKYLNLKNNHLSGTIHSTLSNLTNLAKLYLSDNLLTDELSEPFFEGLQHLDILSIARNHLVFNVSSQWIPPPSSQHIDMGSVFIGTAFPPWLQNMSYLEFLSMRNASIYGAIPDWCLTSNPSLSNLDLSTNLLSGPLPSFDLNDSSSLQVLQLSGNQISGAISEKICNLDQLTTLSLSNNQLTGRIPLCLGNLYVLEILDLGNNSLSGHIPSELGSSGRLATLHLNENNFVGGIPSSFQNLTQLRTLDLGGNELQGFIPEWIGTNMTRLQFLRLESNHFSSEISLRLCQLSSLQILNLADNNLTGTIPRCLANLTMMISEESGLSSDQLVTYDEALLSATKGVELVYYSSSLPYAKFITLSSNRLHGDIPPGIMELKGLQSLNLSKNMLTGRIPENIGHLKHLESFDLSMNLLSGTIPRSLAGIDALGYLNLSFNNLAGKVPSGNHFDTLDDPSIYQGNRELCGKVLMKPCPGDHSATSNQQIGPVSDDDDDEFDRLPWVYAGIGPGFAVGFLGAICILYFKRPWRIAYFEFVDNVFSKVWVTFAIKIAQCRSKFN